MTNGNVVDDDDDYDNDDNNDQDDYGNDDDGDVADDIGGDDSDDAYNENNVDDFLESHPHFPPPFPQVQDRVSFRHLDATTADFPENHFDLLYSRDAIMHIADKDVLYQNAFVRAERRW